MTQGVVAFTGHRPAKLGGYDNRTRLALGGLATEYLAQTRPAKVIVGVALGWDQAGAAACLALQIPFIAAVPFEGQEKRWPEEAQERYRWLLEMAESVEIVTPEPCYSTHLVNRAMQRRNEWMVDRATRICALWDGSWGGTFNCVEYAQTRGVPVDNLWRRWTMPDYLRELLS